MREYDRRRYENKSKTLREAFKKVKRKKYHENDNSPIKKADLHNLTGITYKTINNHDEILDLIENYNRDLLAKDISYIDVDADKLVDLDQAVMIIEELNDINNKLTEKLKHVDKKNKELYKEVALLEEENKELKNELKRAEDKLLEKIS
ncbi:MAG: hypothetical protein ACOC1P_01005 [Minisyncoccales bacterium]